jgi:protoporphyrinogen oxidase
LTDNHKPHILILGGGPAGLGAAYKLVQSGDFRVTLVEQNPQVGGNAGSFNLAGVFVDYGSHRLHPSCDPAILADIRSLLGEDFLDRPRNGRIRLQNRWIRFPLRPSDLLIKLPSKFAAGAVIDQLARPFRRDENINQDSFAAVLERSLGKTICREFYFPYAQKIWGSQPDQLSPIQARRRVSANTPWKIIQKVLSLIPGIRKPGAGRFFYPRCGYGQISSSYELAARRLGAEFLLDTKVLSVDLTQVDAVNVLVEQNGENREICADRVWSTIPVTRLADLIIPSVPRGFRNDFERLDYRGMILIYLVIGQTQFSPYDAHYFPGLDVPITRLSEPKNYSGVKEPIDKTVLCAELPSGPEELFWQASDEDLAEIVVNTLVKAGIPVESPVQDINVKRLRYAYPIYRKGFEPSFTALDTWLAQFDRLLSFGRQGLFAHDNTHHALYMAYSAVDCLDQAGNFNRSQWEEYRSIFETHVVED